MERVQQRCSEVQHSLRPDGRVVTILDRNDDPASWRCGTPRLVPGTSCGLWRRHEMWSSIHRGSSQEQVVDFLGISRHHGGTPAPHLGLLYRRGGCNEPPFVTTYPLPSSGPMDWTCDSLSFLFLPHQRCCVFSFPLSADSCPFCRCLLALARHSLISLLLSL